MMIESVRCMKSLCSCFVDNLVHVLFIFKMHSMAYFGIWLKIKELGHNTCTKELW
jgi:hypothetical protein